MVNLQRWNNWALQHLQEFQPSLHRELQEAGTLDGYLGSIVDRTSTMMHQLRNQGLSEDQAWEYARDILMPTPEPEPDDDLPTDQRTLDLIGASQIAAHWEHDAEPLQGEGLNPAARAPKKASSNEPATTLQKATLITITLFFIGVMFYAHVSGDRKRAESKAALAVQVLPPGVEDKWNAYVDRRVTAAITRSGDMLVVQHSFGAFRIRTGIVSINDPYAVECNAFIGINVTFGSGHSAMSVPVFGLFSNRKAEPEPELGVDGMSVAAKELKSRLCTRVAAHMRKVTSH